MIGGKYCSIDFFLSSTPAVAQSHPFQAGNLKGKFTLKKIQRKSYLLYVSDEENSSVLVAKTGGLECDFT